MVSVIFPAAGQGKRMQAGRNKVFLELSGVPILVRSLLAFSAYPAVSALVVVVAPAEVEETTRLLRDVAGLKPYSVVAGGAERQDSIANGLRAIDASADVVLVHDAARPLVDAATIRRVIEAAETHGAAIAAVRAKNTIKVATETASSCIVQKTPNRAQLWEVQTPQGFRTKVLLDAYERAAQDGFLGTDDASLVERAGYPVHIVESSYRNIKITTPEDLWVAEAFLQNASRERG